MRQLNSLKFTILKWQIMIITLLNMFSLLANGNPVHEFNLPNRSGALSICDNLLQSIDFSKFKEEEVRSEIENIFSQVRGKIIGQEKLIKNIMIAMLADGHVLLEGPPGVAKTRTVKSFSEAIKATWNRIQFVPDLMPRDITGIIEHDRTKNERKLVGSQLPFNFILGDEINRAPERVQAALLEVMEERQFTANGQTIKMPDFFIILATQNPSGERGTFKLPEAQLDRFIMKLLVDYPQHEDERSILKMTVQEKEARYSQKTTTNISNALAASQESILAARKFVLSVKVTEMIEDYVLKIVESTRNPSIYDAELAQYIKSGAGPRGSQSLLLSAMAAAWLNGHPSVEVSDVDSVVTNVLRHRITFDEFSDENSIEKVISQLIKAVKKEMGLDQTRRPSDS
ncbi:MAG: MoxR family ATPase [Bdellovibrionaceae bacterium]|nr:MoxR family ATPase [Pseudobdellovibrionaceae bacterium]